VPAVVKAAILKAVGEGKLVDIGVFTKDGKKLYEIEMVMDGKEYDVLFSEDGTVLKKTFEGLKEDAGEDEGKETEEEEEEEEDEDKGKPVEDPSLSLMEKKVTIDQVPLAVKAAILEAVGEGKLVDFSNRKLLGCPLGARPLC